jgi:hypothetical protein
MRSPHTIQPRRRRFYSLSYTVHIDPVTPTAWIRNYNIREPYRKMATETKISEGLSKNGSTPSEAGEAGLCRYASLTRGRLTHAQQAAGQIQHQTMHIPTKVIHLLRPVKDKLSLRTAEIYRIP